MPFTFIDSFFIDTGRRGMTRGQGRQTKVLPNQIFANAILDCLLFSNEGP